jgi:hypothetical protein
MRSRLSLERRERIGKVLMSLAGLYALVFALYRPSGSIVLHFTVLNVLLLGGLAFGIVGQPARLRLGWKRRSLELAGALALGTVCYLVLSPLLWG